jgi:hypothetical protein
VDSLTDLATSVLRWPLPAVPPLLKLSFYEEHCNEPSTYFTTPILTTYKTPINVFLDPVTDLGIIVTTAGKQSLYRKDGTFQSRNLYHLNSLFDLALLHPEEQYLGVW